MAPPAAPVDPTARRSGATGCAVAVLAGIVGLTLLLLGLLPATTEALPFGVGLLVLALVIAVPSALALRRGWAGGVEAGDESGALGAVARPPASVTCPTCGSAAPLRLAEPTHSTCAHCRTRFALAPELSVALARAAAALHQQATAERQIADTIATLAREERAWTARLAVMSGVLTLGAAAVAVFGFVTRHDRDDWFAWLGFGALAALAAASLGGLALLLVPRAVRQVVGRWAAVRLPGEPGLGCRVCGGPLPAHAAPVLRCPYCAADNLAGGEVLARLAAGARRTQQTVLAVAQRKERGDAIAAFTLRTFPWLVAAVWFAAGAAAGSLGFILTRDLEVGPDDDVRFLVVRVGSSACLAAHEPGDGGTIVYLDANTRRTVPRADLPRYLAAPAIAPAALVGREIDHARVVEVVRPLPRLGMHTARVEGTTLPTYLPNVLGGGQRVCFTDLAAGAGPSLDDLSR